MYASLLAHYKTRISFCSSKIVLIFWKIKTTIRQKYFIGINIRKIFKDVETHMFYVLFSYFFSPFPGRSCSDLPFVLFYSVNKVYTISVLIPYITFQK